MKSIEQSKKLLMMENAQKGKFLRDHFVAVQLVLLPEAAVASDAWHYGYDKQHEEMLT